MGGSSSGRMSMIGVVVMWMVVSAASGQAEESPGGCIPVMVKLEYCINYLIIGGPVPGKCCDGVKGLENMIAQSGDRQGLCMCIKMISSASYINPNYSSTLFHKCGGFRFPIQLSPSTNCSKVH